MNPLARARHVLARRPWLYWSAVLVLAVAGGWAVAAAVAGVDDARRAWGATRDVMVAVDDLAPGDVVAGRVELRPRPTPMVADTAVTSVPPGATARQHVAAGEVLVELDVAPAGGPQVLIPDGWAAVAVAETVPVGARVGDHVTPVSEGAAVAADGVVVGHNAEAVLVAVPADDAPHVAHASSMGALSLVLEP